MTQKNTRCYTWGIVSGVILYVLSLVCAELPYLNISDQTFCTLYAISIIIGAATIVALVFKNREIIWVTLLQLVFMFMSLSCLFVINGYLGTIRFMHELFGISANSTTDNVSGMLSLTFFAIMAVICIISIGITSIISIRKCLKH